MNMQTNMLRTSRLSRVFRRADGKSAVEMAVVLGLVTAVLAVGAAALSGSAQQSWEASADNLGSAMSGQEAKPNGQPESAGGQPGSSGGQTGNQRISSTSR